ncbi:MAG TPA: glycosyltransferase [Isosphaeraceae bacterium]|nr:glycosyltransferase [Isosphaeraceae bacterium]
MRRGIPSPHSWPSSSTPAWLASRSRRESPPGAVLVHAPSTAFQAPGGGENQLVQTARHLEGLEVPVRLFSPWTDRLEAARLLHLFGMSREGLELARLARTRGVPTVLSPICWYEPRAIAALETHPIRKVAGLGAWCLRLLAPRLPSWRRELLHLVDVVLPNSRAEANQLARLFGVARPRLRVVPNGVLPSFGTAEPALFRERWGSDPFVLSVGRIEPRKNTLGLIQAARRLGVRLVIIGEAAPGYRGYAQQCRQAGGDRVAWLGRLDHHDPVLASAYAAARVFALPSWFETPGLAALEAALAGCAVLITPYGSTREYFGDLVAYARPHRPEEIRRGLKQCWDDGPDPRLAPRIASHYLWPIVAQITAEVYDQVARSARSSTRYAVPGMQ